MSFEVGPSSNSKKYSITIKIEDCANLIWKDSPVIRECLKYCERYNFFDTTSMELLKAKLASGNLISSFEKQTVSGITKATIIPQSTGRTTTAGKIGLEGVAVDKDDDILVVFKNDIETFVILVNHQCIDGSFAMLQSRALADAIFLGEPGDKMDRSMFLQYCTTLKKKFNLVKMCRHAHIIPTSLPAEQCGLTFNSEVPLPPFTDQAIDWSPETRARVEGAAGVNRAADELAAMLAQLIQPAGSNAFQLERAGEDAFVQEAINNNANVVCAWSYQVDSDGDMLFTLLSSTRPAVVYIICVKIKDKESFTWTESRAVKDVFELCERCNRISVAIFKGEWATKLGEKGHIDHVELRVQDDKQVMFVICKPARRTTTMGRIKDQQVGMNENSQFVVKFSTDAEEFRFLIDHSMRENSYSSTEGRSLGNCIYFSEPGDKMDERIFLQYCAKLKVKYKKVAVHRRGPHKLIAHITPTQLSESAWGGAAGNAGDVLIPPLEDNPQEWSAATQARINAAIAGGVHRSVTCDGCGILAFGGLRYNCLQCHDYDLCGSCHAGKVVSKGHKLQHPMRVIEPPDGGGGGGAGVQAPIGIPIVGGVHRTVTCDGCGKRAFGGLRYNCLQCHNYDLCGSGHADKVVSKGHTLQHSMRAIEPPG